MRGPGLSREIGFASVLLFVLAVLLGAAIAFGEELFAHDFVALGLVLWIMVEYRRIIKHSASRLRPEDVPEVEEAAADGDDDPVGCGK